MCKFIAFSVTFLQQVRNTSKEFNEYIKSVSIMANKKNYVGWSNPFETQYGKMQSLKLSIEDLRKAVKEAKNDDLYLSIGETKNGKLAVWEDEYKNRSDQSQYQGKGGGDQGQNQGQDSQQQQQQQQTATDKLPF